MQLARSSDDARQCEHCPSTLKNVKRAYARAVIEGRSPPMDFGKLVSAAGGKLTLYYCPRHADLAGEHLAGRFLHRRSRRA